jgi:hypothetical protein
MKGNFFQGWELADFPVAFSTANSLVCARLPLLDGLVSATLLFTCVGMGRAAVNFGMFYKPLFFSVQFPHIMKPYTSSRGRGCSSINGVTVLYRLPSESGTYGPFWSALRGQLVTGARISERQKKLKYMFFARDMGVSLVNVVMYKVKLKIGMTLK